MILEEISARNILDTTSYPALKIAVKREGSCPQFHNSYAVMLKK